MAFTHFIFVPNPGSACAVMAPSSRNVSSLVYQVQTAGLRNGVELDARRLGAKVHQGQQTFVMIGPKVAEQILAGFPMGLIAKGLGITIFLEDSAADATRLHPSRPRPSSKVSPQPLVLCRRYGNADAFNNQIWLPLLTIPAPGTVNR